MILDDGKIIKMSSYQSEKVISEWNICQNGIKEIKIYQVKLIKKSNLMIK